MFQVQDTVFKRRIFLFVGTREVFVKHLTEAWGGQCKKKVPKDARGMMLWFPVKSTFTGVKTRVYYLWSCQFDNTTDDIGTLAHEAFHIATTVMEDLGVDTSDVEGSEGVAYYMETIFVQCLTHLRGE